MNLFDPIRNRWVAATPEEKIRQRLIQQMLGEGGYPKGLLAVEKDLASLPHRPLLREADPHRRLDLLCFMPGEGGLRPLLLVECKAKEIDRAAEKQLFGYNSLVGALFVCLANGVSIRTMWREEKRIASVSFLPPFQQLVENACRF